MSIKQAANEEEVVANEQKIFQHLTKPPVKLAIVPTGTPMRKSWYVKRSRVMDTNFQALTGGGGPRLGGFVGEIGSGETTAASLVFRSTKVPVFSDGIV